MPRLILASSSPRRRELLTGLNIPFSIIKPEVDETQHAGEAPLDYVRRLSQEKAAAVATTLTLPGAVLAADTVVILGADTLGIDAQGEILGKPVDATDARQMLRRLRGRVHRVCTALTLMEIGDGAVEHDSVTRVTCTDVTMRDYSDAEIDAYIATGDPFDKAGSYAIQHVTFAPVAHVDGSYTNVVGLPVETLREMLAAMGWPISE
ncbi:MAG: septum formation protein Maf [Anaerolineaceae bacterium]|nr:septum formation protein Maf [Anaerolineaceae bacterium]